MQIAPILLCWSSDKLFKRKSKENLKLNTNASICTKNIYFISYINPSALERCTSYMNLQITLRFSYSYLLFSMPTDKPLVDSCELYSNVAFRAVCIFPHSSSGFAATTRQKSMVKNVQSVVGVSCRNIQQIHWKISVNMRTTWPVQTLEGHISQDWLKLVETSKLSALNFSPYCVSCFCALMGPIDGGLLVNGCHCPWILGLSVWKGLRMRMMSRPDWLVSLVKSSEICGEVLFVTISSLTLPFTVGRKKEEITNHTVVIDRPAYCEM